jgi:hypothetical protein
VEPGRAEGAGAVIACCFDTTGLMVRRRAQRAVSNHGEEFPNVLPSFETLASLAPQDEGGAGAGFLAR